MEPVEDERGTGWNTWMDDTASLIESLKKYQTMAQLHRSAFYSECRDKIESLLKTPQIYFNPEAQPRLHAFIRIVQWNIEKGKNFGAILDRLQADEILRWADVIVVNEADWGMARSQNRHVAGSRARELGMHMAFAPAHLELTKGTEDKLEIDGENRESIQGNAILSRYPIVNAHVVPLPKTFEPYEFHERRFGWRNCLWAQVQLSPSSLWVGSVHLELRNTPRCRARQISHIMTHLPGDAADAYVLAGDFNTNTFERGSRWRTIKSLLRLLCSPPSMMKTALLHPEKGHEPLFNVLNSHDFNWVGFNSNEETARVPIDSLEEAHTLPRFIQETIKTRLDHYGGFLCFKLDWITGKKVRPLGDGEMVDTSTQVTSRKASSIRGDNSSPGRASDHLPIYADIATGWAGGK